MSKISSGSGRAATSIAYDSKGHLLNFNYGASKPYIFARWSGSQLVRLEDFYSGKYATFEPLGTGTDLHMLPDVFLVLEGHVFPAVESCPLFALMGLFGKAPLMGDYVVKGVGGDAQPPLTVTHTYYPDDTLKQTTVTRGNDRDHARTYTYQWNLPNLRRYVLLGNIWRYGK